MPSLRETKPRQKTRCRLQRLSTFSVLASLIACSSAGAVTFTVNSTVDARDAVSGDGICATAAPAVCTLRAAIEETNALAGADVINLSAGTYVITLDKGDDNAAKGDFDIRDTVTISGAGQTFTIVDGNATDRVFDVRDDGSLTMSDVTIQNGDEGPGGGIRSEGALVLTDVTLKDNVSDKEGGGVAVKKNGSTTTLSNVVFENNRAKKGGGLHMKDNSTATITNATFTDNTARQDGGGVYIDKAAVSISASLFSSNTAEKGGGLFAKNDAANVTVTNTTLSGNTVSKEGGAIWLEKGIVRLVHVTVNANGSPLGGGIYRKNGTLQLQNTIISNSTVGADCSGTVTSLGNNLDTDNSCNLALPGDLPGTPPQLGPLQNNGGLTWTHALLAFSPARDAATGAACPATDQRGNPRPVDGNGDGLAACDIGAYEAEAVLPDYGLQKTVGTFSDPVLGTSNPKAIPGAVMLYTLSVSNNGPGAADLGTLVFTDAVPANTALMVADFDASNPGPVAFVDSTPASGLSYSFTALGSVADNIEFSSDGGASYGYTPTAGPDGSDTSITHFRIMPTGTAWFTGANPGPQFLFKVILR